jgi:hypothetical protein
MRKMLIVGGVGMLSLAVLTVTLDARAQGHGAAHGSRGHGGLEGHMRRGGGHAGHAGSVFPMQLASEPYLFPGEPEPGPAAPGIFTGGAIVGGSEHMTAGHLLNPAGHPLVHVTARVEQGEPLIPQRTAPSADESDQAGAVTAQSDLTASPISARPPGAGGPGRPVSGWSGPGLPGPGRPASPEW